MMTRSRSRDRRRRPSSASPRRRRRHGNSATPSPPPRSKMRSDMVESKSSAITSGSALSRISTASVHARSRAPKLSQEMEELQKRVKKDLFTDDAAAARKFLASGSLTRSEKGYIFQGPEFSDISAKELRKIQIDIRRNIPAHRVSDSPIRRRIANPAEVVTPRGKAEGAQPIFSRDDVLLWLPDITEEKTVQLLNEEDDGGGDKKDDRGRSGRRKRTPSPMGDTGKMRSERRSRSPLGKTGVKSRLGNVNSNNGSDIKSRLGGRENRDRENRDKDRENRDRNGDRSDRRKDGDRRHAKDSVRDRLGDSKDRVLDREELESQRPVVKPWDINPEYVPRGRGYFEHDSREDHGDGDDRFRRGRGNWRGGRMSRGSFRGDSSRRGGRAFYNDRFSDDRDNNRFGYQQRGGNFNSRRRGRSPSPEWKHDKFNEDDQDEPMVT